MDLRGKDIERPPASPARSGARRLHVQRGVGDALRACYGVHAEAPPPELMRLLARLD